MDALLSDIRFAVRSLDKAKTFTAVALVSLALGIGANVTVFSVVNALAFKPLPYAQSDRLVDLHESSATKLCGGCSVGASYPGFVDWRDNAHSVARIAAYTAHSEMNAIAMSSFATFALRAARLVSVPWRRSAPNDLVSPRHPHTRPGLT